MLAECGGRSYQFTLTNLSIESVRSQYTGYRLYQYQYEQIEYFVPRPLLSRWPSWFFHESARILEASLSPLQPLDPAGASDKKAKTWSRNLFPFLLRSRSLICQNIHPGAILDFPSIFFQERPISCVFSISIVVSSLFELDKKTSEIVQKRYRLRQKKTKIHALKAKNKFIHKRKTFPAPYHHLHDLKKESFASILSFPPPRRSLALPRWEFRPFSGG